jgi:hypothetical protein
MLEEADRLSEICILNIKPKLDEDLCNITINLGVKYN